MYIIHQIVMELSNTVRGLFKNKLIKREYKNVIKDIVNADQSQPINFYLCTKIKIFFLLFINGLSKIYARSIFALVDIFK